MIHVSIKDLTDKEDIHVVHMTGRALAGAFFSRKKTDSHAPVEALMYGDLTIGDYLSAASCFVSFAYQEWKAFGLPDSEFMNLVMMMTTDSMTLEETQEKRKNGYEKEKSNDTKD